VIDLWFLDQSGGCPTLPTGYGWGRLGRRLTVPYEAPQGRRVNVVGAIAPFDLAGDAAETVGPRARRCVVVLDTYSVHHSQAVKAVKADTPALAASDVHFCFLPPYRPELNPIESLWRHHKDHDLPDHSHPTDTALQAAIASALTHRANRLHQSTANFSRPA